MLRVVVDPGVIVSALISDRGSPRELVRRWIAGMMEFVVSPLLLDELRTVPLRKAFRRYLTADDAMAFVELLRLTGSMRPDPEATPGLTPDPGDDYLVALARAIAADCIVSGDAHLTELDDPDPPVLTPRQLLEILG